jgi:leader peptidase (prepilin peptidase)/N-methyltransferase
MVSVLVAVSAIDLELWIIPLSLCWFLTAVGVIASVLSIYIIGIEDVSGYELMPVASAGQAALAAGAVPGLVISLVLLKTGIIKRSYEADYAAHDMPDKPGGESEGQAEEADNYDHRLEVLKEVVFLLPIIICAYVAFEITGRGSALRDVWIDFSQYPAMAGLFGSLFGYFVGCGVVWGTRILGTLAFGKEAMGLGDVHIMGAAGAVIGWKFIIVAFLIAPFFGLAWAAVQMFFRKTREIPYGPFLSLGIFAVIILHDRILNYLNFMLYHQPGQ